MVEQKYDSDTTDAQWRLLRPLLPKWSGYGPKPVCRRRVVDAIFYVVRTSCQWRQLPHDFPNWKTVYNIFWKWRNDGVWKRINDALRTKARKKVGKKPTPTAAIIDSQSIRTAEGGELRGYDAGKKITGRKRHIAVDTLGLLLAVVVHPASWQDQDGACFVLSQMKLKFKRLKVVFADGAYGRSGLPDWTKETFGWVLQAVLRPVEMKGFQVLPKRWIVERTFAWMARYRRLSKDYEKTSASSEAFIYISMINKMSRSLAKTKS